MAEPIDNRMTSVPPGNEATGVQPLANAGVEPMEGSGAKRRTKLKPILLLCGILALSLLALLPPVRHAVLDDRLQFKQFIHNCGPWAPLVFTASVAVLVAIGFPRLAFHFLGGALFAFWGGLAWSLIGTMIGYSVSFLAVRQFGLREMMLRRYPSWQNLTAKLKHHSVPAVILFRQIPVPGGMTNVVLGLSAVRRRDFFLGTCIGLLPEAIPMALLGSGLRKDNLAHMVFCLIGAVVLFVIAWIAWGAYTRRAAASDAA